MASGRGMGKDYMDYVGYERDTQVGKTERVGGVLQLVAGLGQGVSDEALSAA